MTMTVTIISILEYETNKKIKINLSSGALDFRKIPRVFKR